MRGRPGDIMNLQTDRTRLAIIGGAILVLIASIIGFMTAGGDDTTSTTPGASDSATITTAAANGDGSDVELPVTGAATASTDAATASTNATASTEGAAGDTTAATESATASTDATAETTASSITFSSSPPVSEGEKRGCAEGLILVGSNGTEPICQAPGAGCPDNYSVIGGVDGALLCKGIEGDVLRVQPDGSVTLDTSVPFNGPVCQKTDADGNILELTLAASEQDCLDRGGEYFPNGI